MNGLIRVGVHCVSEYSVDRFVIIATRPLEQYVVTKGDKLTLFGGRMAIAMAASVLVDKYVDEQIGKFDRFSTRVKEARANKKEVKIAKKQQKINEKLIKLDMEINNIRADQ